MSHNFQNELKKEFQLERMILFSDAVFAIAITLLALEIKVPEVAKNLVSDALLAEKLKDLLPKFLGFLVSFTVIGTYWLMHHRMFGYVVNYTHRLILLNLVFLLAIVLMPFSSGFFSEYAIRQLKLPVLVYVCNIVFIGLTSLLIWNHIVHTKHNLSEGVTTNTNRYFRFRAVMPPLAILTFACVYLFLKSDVALWVALVLVLAIRLFVRFYRRQLTK